MKEYIKKLKLNNLEEKGKFAITIGIFDGLHRGHNLLIDELINQSLVNNLDSGIITFEKDFPKNLKNISSFILTFEEKKEFLTHKGLDFMFILPFNMGVKNLSPEDFINLILEIIPISCICVGSNFTFGKNKIGNIEKLINFEERYGFKVKVIPLAEDNGTVISSSYIRNLLLEGKISLANKLLGYKYFIKGTVIKGENLGSKIGFPTLNISFDKEKLIPKNGIYKGKVKIRDKIYNAGIYIGTRPTFNGDEVRIEAHLIDFSENLYGEEVEITFEEYLRPDQKFNSTDELIKQIEKDIETICKMVEEEEKQSKIITIDGTASSGKTTIAKLIAQKFGFDYIESGALYRSVGYLAKEMNLYNEADIVSYLINHPLYFNWDGKIFRVYNSERELTQLIKNEEVGKLASFVGTLPKVREILTDWQRENLKKIKKGLVVEGRDSGTLVFPRANLKLFVNANLRIRAQRRAQELGENNIERIIQLLKERDKQDITREVAPLRFPLNGYFIDNSYSSLEEIYNKILSLYVRSL